MQQPASAWLSSGQSSQDRIASTSSLSQSAQHANSYNGPALAAQTPEIQASRLNDAYTSRMQEMAGTPGHMREPYGKVSVSQSS